MCRFTDSKYETFDIYMWKNRASTFCISLLSKTLKYCIFFLFRSLFAMKFAVAAHKYINVIFSCSSVSNRLVEFFYCAMQTNTVAQRPYFIFFSHIIIITISFEYFEMFDEKSITILWNCAVDISNTIVFVHCDWFDAV